MTASWRLDLGRILLVLRVRPAASVWPAFMINLQTELGLSIYVTVSDVRNGVTKAHAVVSEIQRDVAGTRAIVSDIRCNVLGSQEGVDDQRRLVGGTVTAHTTACMLTIC